MENQTRDGNQSRLCKTGLAFLAAALALALLAPYCAADAQARGRAWLPKPKRQLDDEPSIRLTVETIRCLVDGRAYSNDAKRQAAQRRFARLEAEYFTPRHLTEIAHAAHDGLKAERKRFPLGHTWQRYIPLLLGHIQQQSHFKRDALSRYNRDRAGRKIRVGNCKALRASGKIRPDDHCRSLDWLFRHPKSDFAQTLDGGLFQMHVKTAARICPGTTLRELLTPGPNLKCAAVWLRKRAETCATWLKATPRRCRKGDNSIRCRCRRVWRKTGALAYQSSTSRTLVKTGGYADQFWRCHDAAKEIVEGTPDGPRS